MFWIFRQFRSVFFSEVVFISFCTYGVKVLGMFSEWRFKAKGYLGKIQDFEIKIKTRGSERSVS